MDESQKKEALRMINYGLYVLTAKDGTEIAAGTVNWLSQCSMKPPTVMVGVKVGGHLMDIIERKRAFAVNVLSEMQKSVANDFFKPTVVTEGKLNGRDYVEGSTGMPILTETPASLECKVHHIVKGGDHNVVVAEVVDASVRAKTEPLFMRSTGWFYGG